VPDNLRLLDAIVNDDVIVHRRICIPSRLVDSVPHRRHIDAVDRTSRDLAAHVHVSKELLPLLSRNAITGSVEVS
jgi:hypothetical protein